MVTNLHTQPTTSATAQVTAPREFAGALERLLAAAGFTSIKTIDITGLDIGDTFSDLVRHKLAKRRKEVEDDDELDDDSEEEEDDDDEDEDEDDDFDEDEEEFEEEFEDDELSDDDDDIFYDDDDDE